MQTSQLGLQLSDHRCVKSVALPIGRDGSAQTTFEIIEFGRGSARRGAASRNAARAR